MTPELFIQQQCRNAPHLTVAVATFMLNAGVETVLEELYAAVPGWECDLYAWLVVDGNDETFVVETDHGGPVRSSVSTTLRRLENYQDRYNGSIALLNTELQQKAHVIT
ncbi:MAG: hypothetical protein EBU46_00255 [Nitrosomonadaceae bacterium]|nr:hypothetical protein [Nitrosomonadaceae bacterium]